MVQILEDNSPQSQRFAGFSRLAQGLGNAAESLKGTLDERQLRADLKKRFGDEFGNVKDPRIREMLVKGALDKEEAEAKRTAELAQLKKHYPELVKRFGQEEADTLMALPSTGAQTDYISHLLKQESRNQGFGTQFGEEEEEPEAEGGPELSEGAPKPPPKKAPIDFDRGLTPEERTRREDKRYTTNLPLFTESRTKLNSAESESENLAILSDLSPQISALERININPQTGDLFLPVAASPEAQRYVKTINDFSRNAKDSYGARVTNFDLTQFMKRLPTLANSEEGRRQIIEQLQIINDINIAHERALQDVLSEHGGIRKIDYDKAQDMAEKRSKKQINELKSKFKNIGSSNEQIYKNQIEEFKKLTPKGHVAVRKADGTMGDISKDRLEDFLKVKGNEVL